VLRVGLLVAALSCQAVVQRPSFVPRYSGAEIGEWTMDHDTALAKAREGTNNVIVMFNGAWWCPHCQALEKTVLTNQAWQAYVQTNRLYLVMMDNPARNDGNWCWLRETNYYENAGLDHDQAEAAITNHYAVQTSYATPDAPTQTVKGVSYLRIGYPTLIVLRPDGSRLGRFSPLMSTVSLEMVIRNVNQLLGADAWDEKDDYYQGATSLETPLRENTETSGGTHTLSEADAADWYAFDATNGVQWSFAFNASGIGVGAQNVKAQIFDTPTNSVSLAERVMTPSDISVLSFTVPKAGRYWLKVSRTQNLTECMGYALTYWYGEPAATVQFASSQVSVSEKALSVTLTVNIIGASANAEVRAAYETAAGSAQPGADYVGTAGELVWGAGPKNAKTVTVPLLSDSVWEGDETFTVNLHAVKNCSEGGQLSVCTVTLKEQVARQPGKLGFEGTNALVLVEGANAIFRVARTSGADGTVTARVEHAQGTFRTAAAQLVWTNGETVAKSFAFAFTNEPGFQPDRTSSLKLTALGGAAPASTAGATVALTRRDALVVKTLSEYAAASENEAFGLKAALGFWFDGYCSDEERDEAWLRSGVIGVKGSATLGSSVQGPGVLAFDWRLAGDGATVQCQIAGKTVAAITNTGVRVDSAFAIPAGNQTVTWTALRGTGTTNVFAAVRHLRWYPLTQTASPQPADQAAVINRTLTFAWQDVLDGAVFPSDTDVRYEFYAGVTAKALAKVSAQTEPEFPRAGNAGDQTALDSLIAKANSKPLYWRIDTVATDALGRRAVDAGSIWSATVLPEGSPEYVASEGGFDPSAPGGVALSGLTVGVYGEAGPLAVTNAGGGGLRVAVRNGALPAGMGVQTRDGAVWIAGVPLKAGQGSVDLNLAVSRKVGNASVTTPGTSVTIGWTVQALGRAAGQFNGYLVTEDGSGYGNASFTVAESGRISGRFVSDGLTYSVEAAAFGGRTNGAYFAAAVAKATTNLLPVTLTVAGDGASAEVKIDGTGDSAYELSRNNWAEADGVARMRAYAGYYTVALPVLTKSSPDAPGGTGYLTLTVKANGTVTYAGQAADGVSLSGSAVLLYGPDCCSAEDRVTFYLFSQPTGYGKASGLYGLVYLKPGDNGDVTEATATAAESEGLRWVNTNPKAVTGYNPVTGELPASGISGFTNSIDVTGGFYDTTVNLQTVYAGRTLRIGTGFIAPDDFDGEQGESGYTLVSVPDTNTLSAAATGASALAFQTDSTINPWALAVRPNRATGLFTGSFKLYYQEVDGTGKTQQKTKNITLKGVFLPVREEYQDYVDWMGFYLVPDTFGYLDAGGKQKAYPFNWAYDFRMDADPVDAK
jgi:hypothetical protein